LVQSTDPTNIAQKSESSLSVMTQQFLN